MVQTALRHLEVPHVRFIGNDSIMRATDIVIDTLREFVWIRRCRRRVASSPSVF